MSTNDSAVVAAEHYTTPGKQAARQVENTGLLKERIMNWIEQNVQDEKMLRLLNLELLSQDIVAHGEGLAELVGRHNDGLVRLTERFGKLADDRKAINSPDKWVGQDSNVVVAERRRLVTESWDALVALRRALDEREELLGKLESHIRGKLASLRQQQEEAFDEARKALVRKHHDYLKSEPVRGQAYVSSLAENDDAVAELRRQAMALTQVMHAVQSAKYKAGHNTPVTIRQREVFDCLN